MKNLILPLSFALALSSCMGTPKFHVSVDGLASPEATELTSFAVESPRAGEDPLLWAEFASYVGRAMEMQGWRPAAPGEDADFVVVVDFGISGPEKYEYTTREPVYGVIGQTTTYSTNHGYSGLESTETSTPEYGVTHYRSSTATGIRFHRHVDMTAFGREAGGDFGGDPVWRTQIQSSGATGDLRVAFPVLLAAAQPYLGRSTGQAVQVLLSGSSDQVAVIKGEV